MIKSELISVSALHQLYRYQYCISCIGISIASAVLESPFVVESILVLVSVSVKIEEFLFPSLC